MENLSPDVQYQAPMKHSRLGIASFIVSLVTLLLFFLIILIAGVYATNNPGAIEQEMSPFLIFIGFITIFALLLCLVGIGLGIAGALQKDRKVVFAVLGLIFNAVIFFGAIGLAILGNLGFRNS